MRLAIISDIHGNRVALDAVLDDLAAERPGQIVCLGDVAAGGPQPWECLRRVRELGGPVVMGNTDRWLLDPPADDDRLEPYIAIERWCAAQLGPGDRAFIGSFRPAVDLVLDGETGLRCVHGSPGSDTGGILATTPDADLEPVLAQSRHRRPAGGRRGRVCIHHRRRPPPGAGAAPGAL